MKICFLDASNIPYTSADINSEKLRGAENAIINLSNEFAKLGNKVYVYNSCLVNIKLNNVHWINLNNINKDIVYDYAFTNNDMRLFNRVNAKHYFAFSHSVQSIEKFIRKGQLISYLKFKPKLILLGKYHNQTRNFLLKIFGKINIQWAVDPDLINTKINDNLIENIGIFTSREDRNLNILIDIWKNKIFPKNKNIKLFTTPSKLIDNRFNIFTRNFGPKKLLINDLLKSKVALIPGHKSEVFCIAAEEARELCVPIITLGIGSLSERVNHGTTGFIAKNTNEFAQYTIEIFQDQKLWTTLRKNLIKKRASKQWNIVAKDLINKIL
jgi:glycosyltransferase involved in cell wall biosynthesis